MTTSPHTSTTIFPTIPYSKSPVKLYKNDQKTLSRIPLLQSWASITVSFSSNFTPTKNLMLTCCQENIILAGFQTVFTDKKESPETHLSGIIDCVFIIFERAILVFWGDQTATRDFDIIFPIYIFWFIWFLSPQSLHTHFLLFQWLSILCCLVRVNKFRISWLK